MVRQTSLEVYEKIEKEGLLSKNRWRVYDLIYRYGAMTGAQISGLYNEHYGKSSVSEVVRNRITELVKQTVVTELGTCKCPVTGNTVMRYDVTANLPISYVPGPTKDERRASALRELKRLRDKYLDKEEFVLLKELIEKI